MISHIFSIWGAKHRFEKSRNIETHERYKNPNAELSNRCRYEASKYMLRIHTFTARNMKNSLTILHYGVSVARTDLQATRLLSLVYGL